VAGLKWKPSARGDLMRFPMKIESNCAHCGLDPAADLLAKTADARSLRVTDR
jgi:hypothetical protein